MESTACPVAILALADGSVFRGISIGAEGHCTGELIFNTAMTGHQEILSSPSSQGRIVAFTFPHIGSTGVNDEDGESDRIQAAGLVVRDCPRQVSSFRATGALPDYLRENGVVAISGVDTRRLTRILREQGRQAACIRVGGQADEAIALARAHSAPPPAPQGTGAAPREWSQGCWRLGQGYGSGAGSGPRLAVLDLGAKYSVFRMLSERGCALTVFSAAASASEILAAQPDGIVVAGTAANPHACGAQQALVAQLLASGRPLLGLSLGMQLLVLATGGALQPLATGSHGANHPVQDVESGRVHISSQDQDFALDPARLPAQWLVTRRSLFNGSLQGIRLSGQPVMGVQALAEGSPGPHDLSMVFDDFIQLMAHRN